MSSVSYTSLKLLASETNINIGRFHIYRVQTDTFKSEVQVSAKNA